MGKRASPYFFENSPIVKGFLFKGKQVSSIVRNCFPLKGSREEEDGKKNLEYSAIDCRIASFRIPLDQQVFF
jgi:hypothetical protein